MAAGVLRRVCLLLLLCLPLLFRPAQSIDAALLLPASLPVQRGLLSLVSDFQFDPEVKTVVAAVSTRRRRLKKQLAATTSPPQDVAPPPPSGVHTDYVEEGYR